MNNVVDFNDVRLTRLLKAFENPPKVRVGILGDKNNRSSAKGKALSNATIGAKHEFGEDGLPVRSFLRMPLIKYLQKYIAKANLFSGPALAQVVKQMSFKPLMVLIGGVGETVVEDAFNSGGFGEWKPSNMSRKKVQMTLVETQQLRRSITSRVDE